LRSGFSATLFLVAALNIHRNKKLTEGTEDLHGSARWANEKEIRDSGLVDQKHGVYIGAWQMRKPARSNTSDTLARNIFSLLLRPDPARRRPGHSNAARMEESAVIFDIKEKTGTEPLVIA